MPGNFHANLRVKDRTVDFFAALGLAFDPTILRREFFHADESHFPGA